MTAVEVLPYDAPRDEWLAARRLGIGASEIAAVMGISPYESPFSLWWKKRNGWETVQSEEMSAGTRLEPVIADWWADTHSSAGVAGGWLVERTGLWRNTERPYQLATPDRLLTLEHHEWSGRSVLECKAALAWDGWTVPDAEGRGEIPVHYRAQVLWQIDCLGLEYAWVAAFSGLSFRSYLIGRDEKDIRAMRAYAERFMASLEADEPPDVDDHSATLPILRRLHSDIEDREQEITAQLRDQLGNAKTAVLIGEKFAIRTTDNKLLLRSPK